MVGINNITTITMDNITQIANGSDLPTFLVQVNNTIYVGWFWFLILLTIWVVLFIAAQKRNDQLLQNMMYSGVIVSILSFFSRAINVLVNGVLMGMLTDVQMWIFPLVTIIIATILWASKE